jgi:dimethylamine monooxygenase subunit A
VHHRGVPFDFSQVVVPFRMQPGLRRVAPGSAQLTPSSADSRHLREKMDVLASVPGQALLHTPGFDDEVVLAAIAAEVAKDERPPFAQEDTDAFVAPRLGWAVRAGQVGGSGDAAIGRLLESMPRALRRTALLCLAFEEDFAVIDGASATIPWLAVCLPSRWAPEEKLGRHFAEVHAPVADNERLVDASEQLAQLVTAGDRWERFVWTFSADPHLQQHPTRRHGGWPESGDATLIGALARFRHERQTFIPVSDARLALFTIHVESEAIAAALTSRAAALRLHASLSSMTAAVLEYKGLAGVRDRLLAWLAQHAAALPTAKP